MRTAHHRAPARDQDDDRRLSRRHRAGDAQARAALIERYLPLARGLAYRYRRTAEPAEDLVQVACVGLVKAVDRWDAERGFAFTSFAVPTILGELRRHFRDATWDVRPPRRLQELCRSVEEARDELNAATGREPKVVDLASRLGRSCDEVEEALQAAEGRRVGSLDVTVIEDDSHSSTAGALIGRDDEGYERAEARATLERLTSVLDDRAREILHLRFGEELRQAEIGEYVGCSQMHVSRIIRASLQRLSAVRSGLTIAS
jgi:RNA polymerase sigma-B factor